MVFSSTVFLFIFLPLVLCVYFVLPRFLRNAWLLVMSLLFYAWGEKVFTFVMLGSITANYIFGLLVEHFKGKRAVKWVVAASVVANLTLLIAYKYAAFLAGALNPVLLSLHLPALDLKPGHLPIGISFFTFHAISYVVDVYRGNATVQRNFFNFALYESLFPQLVAGPIIRYQDIADQINERRETLDGFAYGICRFILGMSKKVLIANTMASTADQIFALNTDGLSAPVAWLGALCYTLQIYFDFSGYSDMAIGLGRMFGFTFIENFNYPYISQSIQEFWRRWHISLSTWFRDYLYIPLGGNRVPPWRIYVNLVTVFFLCGLWHGASWNFVIWGLMHGFFLVLERQKWMAWLDRLWRPLRHAYALFIVMIGWVFFRADTFPEACAYLQTMAGFGPRAPTTHHLPLYIDNVTLLALAAGLIGSMPVAKLMGNLNSSLSRQPALDIAGSLVRVAALSFLFILCTMQLAAGTYNPFIYFRF
jgi:alginate O-acetyltransferase complex protein AlgI